MQSDADTARSGERSRTMYDGGIETRRHRQDGGSTGEGEKILRTHVKPELLESGACRAPRGGHERTYDRLAAAGVKSCSEAQIE